MIQGILSTEVDKWWEHTSSYIEDALQYGVGEYTTEDIKKRIKAKEMQLWIKWEGGVKGVFVTQIMNYPQMKILLVLVLGGKNFKLWRDEVDELLQRYAKANDCKHIEFYGRKGWGSYLKDINYKEQARVYSKEIR